MRYRSKSGARSSRRAVSLHGASSSFSDWTRSTDRISMPRRRMPCDSLLAIRRVPSKITSSATARRFPDPEGLYSSDNVLFLGGKIGAQEFNQSHDLLIRKRSSNGHQHSHGLARGKVPLAFPLIRKYAVG